jgi:hypothetical protein
MQGGQLGQISGGSRCERDYAGCTMVTQAIRVGAPFVKRPSSSRKTSRKLQCAIIRRDQGRKEAQSKGIDVRAR